MTGQLRDPADLPPAKGPWHPLGMRIKRRPRTSTDALEKIKISFLYVKLKRQSSVVQPIVQTSVSRNGFRKEVSGIPGYENAYWRKSFIGGRNLCVNVNVKVKQSLYRL